MYGLLEVWSESHTGFASTVADPDSGLLYNFKSNGQEIWDPGLSHAALEGPIRAKGSANRGSAK